MDILEIPSHKYLSVKFVNICHKILLTKTFCTLVKSLGDLLIELYVTYTNFY